MVHIVKSGDKHVHNLDRRPFRIPNVLREQGPVVIRQQWYEHLSLIAAIKLLERPLFRFRHIFEKRCTANCLGIRAQTNKVVLDELLVIL